MRDMTTYVLECSVGALNKITSTICKELKYPASVDSLNPELGIHVLSTPAPDEYIRKHATILDMER